MKLIICLTFIITQSFKTLY